MWVTLKWIICPVFPCRKKHPGRGYGAIVWDLLQQKQINTQQSDLNRPTQGLGRAYCDIASNLQQNWWFGRFANIRSRMDLCRFVLPLKIEGRSAADTRILSVIIPSHIIHLGWGWWLISGGGDAQFPHGADFRLGYFFISEEGMRAPSWRYHANYAVGRWEIMQLIFKAVWINKMNWEGGVNVCDITTH